jgi:hypothetical protein
MNNYTKQLQDELTNCGREATFEIEVTDKDGEQDFINCEVYFIRNSLRAERVGVSTREEKSKFIANTQIVVDNCLSLDEHLQSLHEKVIEDILDGDLYDVV